MMETMKAYRMTGYTDVDGKSKIRLIDVSEMLPGGPIKDDEKAEDIIGKVVQDAATIAAAGGVGLVLYSALKIAGGGLAARALLKTIQGFSPNAGKAGASAATSLLGKIKSGGIKGIKSLWGGAKNIATLKNTRALATRGFKGAKAAYTLGKVGVGGAIKAFAKGAGRGASKLGSRAIPFVGEVLMIIDAVGSTWNWYSDNQAPRYGEVESFANNEMDPSKLPIGVPITVCWSQPAGGALDQVGLSFLFNNETRTTAELIKIGDKNGESIFIMTQVNSKEVQKALASHDLTLISLDNSDIVNDQASSKEGIFSKIGTAIQRTFDNEDLDFKIFHVDGINDIAAMFNFQGICDWNEFETAYQAAGDQLIVVDPNAPETYEFYYKDNEENVVNVSGRIVSNDELKNSSPEEFQKIFYSEEVEESTKKKNEEHDNSDILGELINESTVITSFGDFSGRLAGIYENKDIDSKKDKTTLELNSEQSSTPAEVAVYVVTEREYADPELRKYKVGVFRNFMINADDYKAKVNSPIEVETNTVNEDIDEPKRGVYVFKKEADKPKPKPSEEEIKRNTQPLTDEDPKQNDQKVKDDYYITVDPKDVVIKDKKNSTVIRDNSFAGGINLVDTFLTDKDKEIMNISNWKAVTYAKASLDTRGDVIEVKIKNKFAPFGDKVRKFKVSDGESFEIAKKFTTEVESRIKYQ
jgi:hypothetical protein